MTQTQQGKKGRKIGRNKIFCKMYTDTNRRVKNKIRKIRRHLKLHPDDLQAARAARAL